MEYDARVLALASENFNQVSKKPQPPTFLNVAKSTGSQTPVHFTSPDTLSHEQVSKSVGQSDLDKYDEWMKEFGSA